MSKDKDLLIESLFMFKALYAGFDKVLGHSLIPSSTPWDDLQQRIEDHLDIKCHAKMEKENDN